MQQLHAVFVSLCLQLRIAVLLLLLQLSHGILRRMQLRLQRTDLQLLLLDAPLKQRSARLRVVAFLAPHRARSCP